MTEEEIIFYRSIHMETRDDRGWDFVVGDPELWKFSDRLVKPEGRVLDVGMGYGRASLFFAFSGMDVEGYDLDPDKIRFVNEYARILRERIDPNFRLNIHGGIRDIMDVDLIASSFDVAVLSQIFIHSNSKKSAYEILDKVLPAVKNGGYIWLRAVGKEDYTREALLYSWERQASQQDADVVRALCTCSGKVQLDPFQNRSHKL